jgi:metal-sulfur cluster biosynthetic enzyme
MIGDATMHLAEMGLVEEVAIDGGQEGVESFEVTMSTSQLWTPDRIRRR